MSKKYVIKLSKEDRKRFEEMLKRGSALQIRRAQTLLMSDAGQTDEAIAVALRITSHTVALTRKWWAEGYFGPELKDRSRQSNRSNMEI
jgi:hypothetical protein